MRCNTKVFGKVLEYTMALGCGAASAVSFSGGDPLFGVLFAMLTAMWSLIFTVRDAPTP